MAAKLKLLKASPARVLIPVRGGRKSNKDLGRDRKYLTPEEVERLEKVVKRNRNGTRDWLLVHMAARHGFRASEIVNLKRCDIDLDKGRMQVRRLKGGQATVHPLDGATLRALRQLYRETGDSVYVFVSERGGPMAREAFQRLVERAGRAARLAFAVHPHMLRHACGYRLANEGKDAFAIQGWLGHQSLGMTKGYCALAADRFKDW
jgi:type 1 fimbriae regulatory protein FimB/type 1 fimbriae regulatory protein FimE